MSASGVSVDLKKVKAVMSWERSKSVFKIRSTYDEVDLEEIHQGFLTIRSTYDEVDLEGGQF